MRYYSYDGDAHAAGLVRELADHPDFRVLTRLPRRDELWLAPTPREGAAMTLAVVDAETTGLDPQHDDMIELSVVQMRLGAEGELLDMAAPITMLEAPTGSIPPAVEALTGLTDQCVAGQTFRDARLQHALRGVDVMVSHNARFDRAFFVRRFPWLRLPWACTLGDLDWTTFGLEGRALGQLLASAGHFQARGHRAEADAWALACLLAQVADDGRAIAAHLIERALRPTWRLYAWEAPYATREVLKRAGYRWDAGRRVWWRGGDDETIGAERVFLRSLSDAIRPEVVAIDWVSRYAT